MLSQLIQSHIWLGYVKVLMLYLKSSLSSEHYDQHSILCLKYNIRYFDPDLRPNFSFKRMKNNTIILNIIIQMYLYKSKYLKYNNNKCKQIRDVHQFVQSYKHVKHIHLYKLNTFYAIYTSV